MPRDVQLRSAALFAGTEVDSEPFLRSRSTAVPRSWRSKFAVEPQRRVMENRIVRHPATTEVVIG
jgi:hypothetical protein